MKRRTERAGMTLVEVVVAAALASALMGGLVSALVLSSRALPTAGASRDSRTADTVALEQLNSDLFGAIDISAHDAHSITFSVADRDADGNPETIRYAWTGVPDAPLVRTYNGTKSGSVAESVQSFVLDYTLLTTSSTRERIVSTDSGEIPLASFTGWSGVTGTIAGYLIAANSWPVEHVRVTATLPNNLTRLDITRVVLYLRDSSATAETLTMTLYQPAVALQPQPSLSKPLGSPVVVGDTGLTASYQAINFPFSNVTFSQPISEFVIAVKSNNSSGNGIRAEYVTSTSGPTNDTQTMLWTTDNGATWLPASAQRNRNDMYYTVYGRYYTNSTVTEESSRYFVTGVSATLSTSKSSSPVVTTMVQTVNAPEVDAP